MSFEAGRAGELKGFDQAGPGWPLPRLAGNWWAAEMGSFEGLARGSLAPSIAILSRRLRVQDLRMTHGAEGLHAAAASDDPRGACSEAV